MQYHRNGVSNCFKTLHHNIVVQLCNKLAHEFHCKMLGVCYYFGVCRVPKVAFLLPPTK